MITVSCYKAIENHLSKAFCRLAEKCYYSDLKSNVVTMSSDYSEMLDRSLWTYSKQHFIPHATCLDAMPEKQPIYITHNTESLIPSEIMIFINITNDALLKVISNMNKESVQKMLFIFDEIQNLQFEGIKSTLEKSDIKDFTIKSFTQNHKGGWIET